jgi:hypothetical protein
VSTWAPQRLPITLDPMPGEGLDSWVEAYARRLRACSSDLLDHLGLTGAALTRMVTTLTARERDTISAATGIDYNVLTVMTLQPFHGVAVTIDPARRVVVHPPAWRRQTGSRFCPTCLRAGDGRWLLRWRLPWSFACPVHACLLVDLCPGCGKRPAAHRPGTRASATIAGRCTVGLPNSRPGGWRGQLCGHPLTDIVAVGLPAGGRVLAAQQRIDRLLSTAAGAADTALRQRICRTLSELHVLAYKSLDALHAIPTDTAHVVHSVLDECGGAMPTPRGPLDSYDAHTIATATTIAVAANHGDRVGDAVLSWIIAADRRKRTPPEPSRILRPWTNADPALTARVLAALDPHIQAHDRLVYATASRRPRRPDATDQQIRRRAASLPTMLWPTWAIRLIPANITAHNTVTATRTGLAVLTLIPGTRLTTRQAIDLLDAGTSSPSANNTMRYLTDEQRTATIAILTDLAQALDTAPSPIDYTRRRALFARCAVDRGAYTRLATAHGWPPPSPLQLRILDDHLAVQLIGAHPGHHTAAARWSTADAWNPLAVALPLPARDFVHDQAEQLLRCHHIDEPVAWQPPPPADTHWPGIDPATIDPDTFTRAFIAHATARNSLSRICRATGLTGVQVRLYTRIADQPMTEQQWDALAEHPDHDVGDPATLRHLYHDQQLSMTDIARLSLTTERVVRNTLTDTGTTLLPRRPRSRRVPLAWLQQHYVNSGKTIEQAAAEAGVSRNTFSKYARLHNIHTGPHAQPVNPFAGWPARQQPPATVVAAFSGAHGVEYVRQVLHIPGRPTRRAAAAALGLHERVLCHHRQHVERAAGIRIFEPDPPLTPTPEGARFLHDATQALQRLDRTESGNP